MAISITMMSPKGGSGKTTLALSMASVFAACNIKTLVIDCDLSTKGATVFLSPYIKNRNVRSSYTLFVKGVLEGELTQVIKGTYSFIPADALNFPESGDVNTSRNSINRTYEISSNSDNVNSSLEKLEADYDVIIYDCCAGESSILNYLEKRAYTKDRKTYIVSVMELDSLSELAFQNMLFTSDNDRYRRIDTYDNVMYRKIYNRIAESDFEDIKEGSKGEVIRNPYNIKWDSSARAFARRGEYPKVDKFSQEYKEQIMELCYIFAEGQETILEKLNEKIEEIKKNKAEQKKEKMKQSIAYSLPTAILGMLILLLVVCVEIFASGIMESRTVFLTISIAVILICTSAILPIYTIFSNIKKRY